MFRMESDARALTSILSGRGDASAPGEACSRQKTTLLFSNRELADVMALSKRRADTCELQKPRNRETK